MSASFSRYFAVGVSALVMLGLATAATPAYAASNVAVDLPNRPVEGGATVNVPIAISGFSDDVTNLTVSLSVAVGAGTLTVDSGDRTLPLNPGFGSLVDQQEISFNGSLDAVTAVLADSVSWTAPNDAPSNLKINVRVGKFETGISWDPSTGKSYQYVSFPPPSRGGATRRRRMEGGSGRCKSPDDREQAGLLDQHHVKS